MGSLAGIVYLWQRAFVEYIGAQLDKEDAEEKVAMEKEASEAVLAAVCDATCWLSGDDGDTIQGSNAKLEAILGPWHFHGAMNHSPNRVSKLSFKSYNKKYQKVKLSFKGVLTP